MHVPLKLLFLVNILKCYITLRKPLTILSIGHEHKDFHENRLRTTQMHRNYSGLRQNWWSKIKNLKPQRNRNIFLCPQEGPFEKRCLLTGIILGFYFNEFCNYFQSKVDQKRHFKKWDVLRKLACSCKLCRHQKAGNH